MAQGGAGAAAGAALGNAFAPGVGGAVGGLMGSFLDGGGSRSSGAPAGPMNSEAAVYGSGLDSSGWNINFAGTQNNASNKAGLPVLGETLGLTGGGGILPGGINSTYLLIGALLVGVVIWKKSRSK